MYLIVICYVMYGHFIKVLYFSKIIILYNKLQWGTWVFLIIIFEKMCVAEPKPKARYTCACVNVQASIAHALIQNYTLLSHYIHRECNLHSLWPLINLSIDNVNILLWYYIRFRDYRTTLQTYTLLQYTELICGHSRQLRCDVVLPSHRVAAAARHTIIQLFLSSMFTFGETSSHMVGDVYPIYTYGTWGPV